MSTVKQKLFKVLVHNNNYVNSQILFRRIDYLLEPNLLPNETTMDSLIEDIKKFSEDMNNYPLESYIENLRQCTLRTVELSEL